MTDKRLNKLVASKLGVKPGKDYCNDISLAWDCVEKLGPCFAGLFRDWDTANYYLSWSNGTLSTDSIGGQDGPEDKRAARAICLTFLKVPRSYHA